MAEGRVDRQWPILGNLVARIHKTKVHSNGQALHKVRRIRDFLNDVGIYRLGMNRRRLVHWPETASWGVNSVSLSTLQPDGVPYALTFSSEKWA